MDTTKDDAAKEHKMKGMLRDHSGKRSNSRFVSFLCTIALVGIAVGVAGFEWVQPSIEFLVILGGGMLGPIGFNRYFGEEGAKAFAEAVRAR